MFHNMISCSRTWNRVPKTCSMFKNMNHVLEHDFMFWNMISCSNRVQVIKHDFNIKSCSETWFHVPEHEIVFRKHALCLRTWIMFWTSAIRWVTILVTISYNMPSYWNPWYNITILQYLNNMVLQYCHQYCHLILYFILYDVVDIVQNCKPSTILYLILLCIVTH